MSVLQLKSINKALLEKNRWILITVKVVICAAIVVLTLHDVVNITLTGSLYNDHVVDIINEIDGDVVVVPLSEGIEQEITAKGDSLSYIDVYLTGISDDERGFLVINLYDSDDVLVYEKEAAFLDLENDAFSRITLDAEGLVRNESYTLSLSVADTDAAIYTYADIYLGDEAGLEGSSYDEDKTYDLILQMHYTYSYLTFASVAIYAARLGWALLLAVMLCVAVAKFEQCLSVLHCREKRLTSILWAGTLSLSYVFYFNPLEDQRVEVTEFVRQFGIGFINNYDPDRVVNNFYSCFALFTGSFVLFYLLMHSIRQRTYNEQDMAVWKFLDGVVLVTLIRIGLRTLSYLAEPDSSSAFSYSEYMLLLMIAAGGGYILLQLHKRIPADSFLALEIALFAASYPVAILFVREWESGESLFGVQMIFLLAGLVLARWMPGISTVRFGSLITGTVIVISGFPLFTSFYIELINVLNQYSVFVGSPARWYGIGACLLAAAAVLFALLRDRTHICAKWRNITYPVLILGVSFLSGQISLQETYTANFMESANYSVLISDFLNFGDIPVVEHYGGHLMTGVWEGILYAFVNSDYEGAIFSPYSSILNPFVILLFYFLVSSLTSREIAAVYTLFLPFYSSWYYYGMGVAVCLAFCLYLKKPSFCRAVLVWLISIWCVVYRLDLGYAFVIATLLVTVFYSLAYQDRKVFRQIFTAMVICVGIFGILCVVLCLARGVDPWIRLKEFIHISASNQKRGFNGIGTLTLTNVSWAYIIVPFACALTLAYAVLSRRFRENAPRYAYVIMLFLGAAYFANVPRTLVRHSMVESATQVVFFSAYAFLAMFVALLCRKGRLFLPLFTGLIVINSGMMSLNSYGASSVVDSSMMQIDSMIDFWETDRFADDYGEESLTVWEEIQEDEEVVERVEWSESTSSYVESLRQVMDILLDEDETFLDFVNCTFLYSALKRECPVYVAQSPIILSDEFTQECFVDEIESMGDRVAIALMPVVSSDYVNANAIATDWISNAYRYYRVSEYIYQNYTPLCYGGNFAIWCRKDRYEEMSSMLSAEMNLEVLDDAVVNQCDIVIKNAAAQVTVDGEDPYIQDLQDLVDISEYAGADISITVSFEEGTSGIMQLFYAEDGCDYSPENCVTVNLTEGSSSASFELTYEEGMHLRLDLPADGITITGLKVSAAYGIDYGYDAGTVNEDGTVTYNRLHEYSIGQLAYQWATYDSEDAISNEEIAEADRLTRTLWVFDELDEEKKESGNYLLLSMNYSGEDEEGLTLDDDEIKYDVTLKFGVYEDGVFDEKYAIGFTALEGENNYLFRISTDYYWHSEDINAVVLEDGEMSDIEMKILEGD